MFRLGQLSNQLHTDEFSYQQRFHLGTPLLLSVLPNNEGICGKTVTHIILYSDQQSSYLSKELRKFCRLRRRKGQGDLWAFL